MWELCTFPSILCCEPKSSLKYSLSNFLKSVSGIKCCNRKRLSLTEFARGNTGVSSSRRERERVTNTEMTVKDFKGPNCQNFPGQAEKAGFCSVGRKESGKVLSLEVTK